MIVTKSLKKKILISSITCASGIFLISAAIGGYYSSCNSNPYKPFYRTIANDSKQALFSAYLAAKMDGAKLLLLPGFALKPSLELALNDPRFNNMGFLLIDDIYKGLSTTQVASLNFRVDEGSFITGISIGMYLNQYKDYFKKDDGQLTWGCYGGSNISPVTSYMGGFQQGIQFFNEKIVPSSEGLEPIQQIILGNSVGDNFAGGFGPTDGNAIIDKFLLKPIDCLIPVAGPQASSAASKIQQKNKRTIVIGVDSPLENNSLFNNYKLPNDPTCLSPTQIIPFSSLKKLETIIPKIITKMNDGSSNENNIGGLGYNSLGNIENNGVGVSQSGEKYFIDAIQKINPSSSNIDSALTYIKSQSEFTRLSEKQYSVYYAQQKPNYNPNPVENDKIGSFPYSIQLEGTQMEPFNPNKVEPTSNMNLNQWKEKENFNLKNFVTKGCQKDSDKIELILSTANSVLLDSSFAEASYIGMYTFFKENDINIPPIKGK